MGEVPCDANHLAMQSRSYLALGHRGIVRRPGAAETNQRRMGGGGGRVVVVVVVIVAPQKGPSSCIMAILLLNFEVATKPMALPS